MERIRHCLLIERHQDLGDIIPYASQCNCFINYLVIAWLTITIRSWRALVPAPGHHLHTTLVVLLSLWRSDTPACPTASAPDAPLTNTACSFPQFCKAQEWLLLPPQREKHRSRETQEQSTVLKVWAEGVVLLTDSCFLSQEMNMIHCKDYFDKLLLISTIPRLTGQVMKIKAQVFLEMRLDPVSALVYQSSDQEVSVSLPWQFPLRSYWSWEACEPDSEGYFPLCFALSIKYLMSNICGNPRKMILSLCQNWCGILVANGHLQSLQLPLKRLQSLGWFCCKLSAPLHPVASYVAQSKGCVTPDLTSLLWASVVVMHKCIICAFEISGRWSRESIYTTLLPGHSCGPGAPTSWETHRLEPYSGAFYETKIPMGSSAYSPLDRFIRANPHRKIGIRRRNPQRPCSAENEADEQIKWLTSMSDTFLNTDFYEDELVLESTEYEMLLPKIMLRLTGFFPTFCFCSNDTF
ncbi:hypothetical protein EK904_009488 [Melospiza melodia maxima]|nr:hypothetical protein EK904_009488 [Melospiza melodia maxima]